MKINNYHKEKKIIVERFLKVPVIENCEAFAENDNGFKIELLFKDGLQIDVGVIVLKNATPLKISEIIEWKELPDNRTYHIVIAPYISDKSASMCEEKGIGYCDMSGNCLIQIQSLYIREKGNPNKNPSKREVKNIFYISSSISSKILREMLKDVRIRWKMRDLSNKVDCSIGMIARVKSYLREQRWIDVTEDGMKIADSEELIKAWSKVYKVESKNMISCYSLDNPSMFERKCRDIKQKYGIDTYLTGFSGGSRYAPVVRYNRVHLWIREEDVQEFILAAGCNVVSTGANVIIYILPGEEYLLDSRIINGDSVVSPVQAYLDCMQLKGRGEEMAEAIYEREIRK